MITDANINQEESKVTIQQRVAKSLKLFTGVAIKCQGKEITYDEYDIATDRIADNLAGKGIKAGDVVCLKMKRSEKMLIALGGVFKSGAALLPVQYSVAPKRLEAITESVDIAITITDDNFDELMNDTPTPGIVVSTAGPDDMAVIVFTSGSTGKPKGVRHSQFAFAYRATQHPDELKNIGINNITISHIISKTNIDFMSAYDNEYLPFLLAGIPLVLLTEEEMNNSAMIAAAIHENENCGIFLTPSQAESYIRQEQIDFRKLNCLVLAGEPLSGTQRNNIIASVTDNTQVVSYYGATECHLITASNCREWDKTSGTVCEDCAVIIVDNDGNICENGEDGEILVSSPKLLTDYIGAEVNKTEVGGKLYFHTKDYGNKTADGRVLIKGRTDRMIKYHGLRVELGEIENNILSFPNIRKVAVTEADTDVGTKVLCAYYESDSEIDEKEIRQYLMEIMPIYMTPAGFIRLEKIPVNDRGKIDFTNLRSRVFITRHSEDDNNEKAGYSEIAELIRDAAAKILKSDTRIGYRDDLLKLGMDSLMAYNLINELRKSGYALTMEQIFMNPVIIDLAEKVEKIVDKQNDITNDYDPDETFTATITQSFWGTEIDAFKKSIGFYNSECFICGKKYSEDEFKTRVITIVKRHPAFAASFAVSEFVATQTISGTPIVVTEYYDIADSTDNNESSHEITEEQRKYIEQYKTEDECRIIGDDRIISLKAVCFAVNKTTSVILFTCNHASTDASSMRVLRDEFLVNELPERKDEYIAYLRYIGDRKNIGEAVNFWASCLKGIEPAKLNVKENGFVQGHIPDFKSYTIKLGKDKTERFVEKCKKENVSPAGYVLYAYGRALLEILGKESLIMQILSSGRGLPLEGIEKTVGCMLQTIPVVIKREDTPSDFRKGYMKCDRYSFLPLPMLWNAVLGNPMPPALPPFLVSEVFPKSDTDIYYKNVNDIDFEKKPVGNYITMDDENGLSIYFHYDANELVEDEFLSIIKATENNIISFE